MPSYFHRGKCSAVWSNQKQLVEVLIRFARKTELFPLQKYFHRSEALHEYSKYFYTENKQVCISFIINPLFPHAVLTHLTLQLSLCVMFHLWLYSDYNFCLSLLIPCYGSLIGIHLLFAQKKKVAALPSKPFF